MILKGDRKSILIFIALSLFAAFLFDCFLETNSHRRKEFVSKFLGTSDELKYVHDAEIQISLAVF
jgi:hypothetical protein